jgi:DNA-binding XRE family transcriptional regulator
MEYPQLPNLVARMIYFNNYHPVRAWRHYYSVSQELLAEAMGLPQKTIIELESSNLHLHPDYTHKLQTVFGLVRQAIYIRYNSFT